MSELYWEGYAGQLIAEANTAREKARSDYYRIAELEAERDNFRDLLANSCDEARSDNKQCLIAQKLETERDKACDEAFDAETKYAKLRDVLPKIRKLVMRDCRNCEGSGYPYSDEVSKKTKCPDCHGTGEVPVKCKARCQNGKRPTRDFSIPNGTGMIFDLECDICDGDGYETELVLRLPGDDVWTVTHHKIVKDAIHGIYRQGFTTDLSAEFDLLQDAKHFYASKLTAERIGGAG